DLPDLPLRWQQILMVNCTAQMSAPARERVRRFVNAGGMLYTTDHAVHYLIEQIFPGTIRFNQRTTQQEIFPMQVQGDRGVEEKKADLPRVDKLYDGMLARRVELRSAPAPAAEAVTAPSGAKMQDSANARVRVLQRAEKYVQVRDEQGNEGWVEVDALK